MRMKNAVEVREVNSAKKTPDMTKQDQTEEGHGPTQQNHREREREKEREREREEREKKR